MLLRERRSRDALGSQCVFDEHEEVERLAIPRPLLGDGEPDRDQACQRSAECASGGCVDDQDVSLGLEPLKILERID